jgi:hypothetical protein
MTSRRLPRSRHAGRYVPPPVRFGPGAHVRLLEGSFADECGIVRGVIAVDPEPRYRVEIDATHISLDVPQSALGTA